MSPGITQRGNPLALMSGDGSRQGGRARVFPGGRPLVNLQYQIRRSTCLEKRRHGGHTCAVSRVPLVSSSDGPVTTGPSLGAVRGAVAPVLAGVVAGLWAVLASSLAVAAIVRGDSPIPPPVLLLTQAVGVFFIATGLVAWVQSRRDTRIGMLLILVGVTWYIGDLQFSADPIVFGVGFWLYHLNIAVLAHLLLAYPDGRLDCAARVVVILLYVTTLVIQGIRALVERPLQPQGWGDPNAPISIWAPIGSVVGAGLAVAVVALIARRWRAESPAARSVRRLYWTAVNLLAAVVTIGTMAGLARLPVRVQAWVILGYALAQAVLGAAVLSGSMLTRLAHRRVSRLAADLQPTSAMRHDELQDKLADALGDPSLTLHFPRDSSDGTTGYVDLAGRPAPLPNDGSDRAVTFIGPAAAPHAVLVHDPFLERHPQHAARLAAVKSIAALALEVAALRAASSAHLRHMVAAEQQAERAIRKQLQETLHDGPQHRLSVLQILASQLSGQADDHPDAQIVCQIREQLQEVVNDLRDVTQGVYPSALRWGLGAALDPLAQRSPVPLRIDVPERLDCAGLELTVFFLASELVGNALKHAEARHIFVTVTEGQGWVKMEVTDDGVGSAALHADGGGLRRWRDRASAMGGKFSLESPPRGGTRIRVDLPCE